MNHIHFINRGLACIVKVMADGRTVEIGAIGIEGATNPLLLVNGARAPLETIVQIPGSALRMGRQALNCEMENDRAFRDLMQRYLRFALSELARHVACNRLHSLEQRCCHWLLIARDSALSNELPVTHEFLAMMLGYQRAGVSIAMSSLAKAGLIKHRRGRVIISNLPALQAATCECYRETRKELDEFLPPSKTARVLDTCRTEFRADASVSSMVAEEGHL
jgi:CRP-like cAMP-binding protein